MIKSRRMRWAGHVASMRMQNAYRILVGKPEGKRRIGKLDVGRIIFKCVLVK
jgi:hypothetical protein